MSKRTDVLKLLRERKMLESSTALAPSLKAELIADVDAQLKVLEAQQSLELPSVKTALDPAVQAGAGGKPAK